MKQHDLNEDIVLSFAQPMQSQTLTTQTKHIQNNVKQLMTQSKHDDHNDQSNEKLIQMKQTKKL